ALHHKREQSSARAAGAEHEALLAQIAQSLALLVCMVQSPALLAERAAKQQDGSKIIPARRLPLRGLRLQPAARPYVAVDEVEHHLVPGLRVTRREDPVVLVGELQEPVRQRFGLAVEPADQVPPQPQRLADRYPV